MLKNLPQWLRQFPKSFFKAKASAETSSPDYVSDLVALIPAAISEGANAKNALAQTLFETGLVQLKSGFPASAARALSAIRNLGFEAPAFDYNLALAYSRSGQALKAHESFERALSKPLVDRVGDGYYLRNAHALEGMDLEDLRQIAVLWADRHVKHTQSFEHSDRLPVTGKLRVGLMSARFSRHAAGFLTLAGLEHVNRERIEFFLYANQSPDDDYTTRFRAIASTWHDITDLNDDDAAQLIHSHQLDILIDMAGHSAGGRMGVIARKPAPIQAKWAGGQHGTTGILALDYFITDDVETPIDHDPYFFETPARLPNAYACYTPPPDTPPVRPLPFLSNNYITFGCFNNIAKLSDGTITAWARILEAVPKSKLVLKHLALAEKETCDRIAAQFLELGIPSARLDMRPPTDQVSHLESYGDIDIALDPFPWSGCVTTCESLWMGVPVLTLPGVAFCHRHSASFLSAAGLSDWVCTDVDDYIQKAKMFAQDSFGLEELRKNLRADISKSPLCDSQVFAKDFENLLVKMVNAKSLN